MNPNPNENKSINEDASFLNSFYNKGTKAALNKQGLQQTGYENAASVQGGTAFQPLGEYDNINPVNDPSKQNLMRAINQDNWDAFTTRLKQTPTNLLGGIIEGVGYLGALVGEWGDNRDYDNILTQVGQSISNWGKEGNEVYAKDPTNPLGFLTDGGAAIDTLASTVESVAMFFAEGAGVAKVMAGIGSLARASSTAVALNRVQKVRKAAQTVEQIRKGQDRTRQLLGAARQFSNASKTLEQIATIPTVSFIEGAMSANKVYKKVEQELKGKINPKTKAEYTEDEIKHIASQSASTTAQLNTVINSFLNITSLAPFFKPAKARSVFNREVNKAVQEVEESLGRGLTSKEKKAVFERLNDLDTKTGVAEIDRIGKLNYAAEKGGIKDYLVGKGITSFPSSVAGESLQEGLEELTNVFAEKTGEELGMKGKTKGFLEQFAELGMYAERVGTKEGLASFILGAAMGGAMKVGGSLMYTKDNETVSEKVRTIDSYKARLDNNDASLVAEAKENGFESPQEYVQELEKNPSFMEERLVQSKKEDGTWKRNSQWVAEKEKANFEQVQFQVYQDLTKLKTIEENIQKEYDKPQVDVNKVNMLKKEALKQGAMLNAFRNNTTEYFINYFQDITLMDNETDLGDKVLEEIRKVDEQIATYQNSAVNQDDSQAGTDTREAIQKLEEQKKSLVAEYETYAGKTEAMIKGFAENKDSILQEYDFRQQAKELIAEFSNNKNLYENYQTVFNKGDKFDGLYAEHLYLLDREIEGNNYYLQQSKEKVEEFEKEIGNIKTKNAEDFIALDLTDENVVKQLSKELEYEVDVTKKEEIEEKMFEKAFQGNSKYQELFAKAETLRGTNFLDNIREAAEILNFADLEESFKAKKNVELLTKQFDYLKTNEGKKAFVDSYKKQQEQFTQDVTQARNEITREVNRPVVEELEREVRTNPTPANARNLQTARNSNEPLTGENLEVPMTQSYGEEPIVGLGGQAPLTMSNQQEVPLTSSDTSQEVPLTLNDNIPPPTSEYGNSQEVPMTGIQMQQEIPLTMPREEVPMTSDIGRQEIPLTTDMVQAPPLTINDVQGREEVPMTNLSDSESNANRKVPLMEEPITLRQREEKPIAKKESLVDKNKRRVAFYNQALQNIEYATVDNSSMSAEEKRAFIRQAVKEGELFNIDKGVNQGVAVFDKAGFPLYVEEYNAKEDKVLVYNPVNGKAYYLPISGIKEVRYPKSNIAKLQSIANRVQKLEDEDFTYGSISSTNYSDTEYTRPISYSEDETYDGRTTLPIQFTEKKGKEVVRKEVPFSNWTEGKDRDTKTIQENTLAANEKLNKSKDLTRDFDGFKVVQLKDKQSDKELDELLDKIGRDGYKGKTIPDNAQFFVGKENGKWIAFPIKSDTVLDNFTLQRTNNHYWNIDPKADFVPLSEFAKQFGGVSRYVIDYGQGFVALDNDFVQLQGQQGKLYVEFNGLSRPMEAKSRPLSEDEKQLTKQLLLDYINAIITGNAKSNTEINSLKVNGNTTFKDALRYYIPYGKGKKMPYRLDISYVDGKYKLDFGTQSIYNMGNITNWIENNYLDFADSYFVNIPLEGLAKAKENDGKVSIPILNNGKVEFKEVVYEDWLNENVLRTQVDANLPLVQYIKFIPKPKVNEAEIKQEADEVITVPKTEGTIATDVFSQLEEEIKNGKIKSTEELSKKIKELKEANKEITRQESVKLRAYFKKDDGFNSKFKGEGEVTKKELENIAKMLNMDIFSVQKVALSGAVGRLTSDAKILLDENAPAGTAYHEVFEAVYNFFYSPIEQAAVLNQLRKTGFKNTAKYKEIQTLYSDKSQNEKDKEYLAEMYRDYSLNRDSMPSGYIKTMFDKLMRFLKSLLKVTPTIEEKFAEIYEGKYKSKTSLNTYQSNFKSADMRLNLEGKKYDYIATTEVLDGLSSYLFNEIMNKDNVYDLTKIGKEALGKHYKNAIESLVSKLNDTTSDLYEDGLDSDADMLADLMENIEENPNQLVKQHLQWLKQDKLSFSADEVDVDIYDNEEQNTEDIDPDLGQTQKGAEVFGVEAYKYSVTDKMSTIVKTLLAGIPKMEEDGRMAYNSLGLVPVNEFKKLHDYLLLNLVGVPDIAIFSKLGLLANQKPEIKILLNRLGLVEKTKEGQIVHKDFWVDDKLPLAEQQKKFQLQTQFVQHFAKTRLDFTIQTLGEDGKGRNLDAVALEERKDIKQQFKQKFANIAEKENLSTSDIPKLHLDTFSGLSDQDKKTANELLTKVFNDFLAYRKEIKGEEEDVYKEGLLNFIDNTEEGGNLNKLVDIYLKQDEKKELSLFNSEGKRVYSVSLNTFLTMTFDTLEYLAADPSFQNSTEVEKEQLIDSYLPHVLHIGSRNSAWLESVLKGRGSVKNSILDGVQTADKKLPSNELSKTDKHYQNINATLEGIFTYLRAGDRSKEDAFRVSKDLIIKNGQDFNKRMKGYLTDEIAQIAAMLDGQYDNFLYLEKQAKLVKSANEKLATDKVVTDAHKIFDYFAKFMSDETATNILRDIEKAKATTSDYNEIANQVIKGINNNFLDNMFTTLVLEVGKDYAKGLIEDGIGTKADGGYGINWEVKNSKPIIISEEIAKAYDYKESPYLFYTSYLWNDIASKLEQSKLINGAFFSYKNLDDITKRASLPNATRQISLKGEAFNRVKQQVYPIVSDIEDINGRYRTDRSSAINSDLETITVFADIKAVSTSLDLLREGFETTADQLGYTGEKKDKFIAAKMKAYESMDEADAFARYTLDAAKEIMVRNGDAYDSVTDEVFIKEKELQYAIRQHFNKIAKEDYKTIPVRDENGELTYLEPEEFIKNFSHRNYGKYEGANFPQMKGQGFGIVQNGSGYNKVFVSNIDKESGGIIVPSSTYRIDADGNIVYREMAKVMLELEERGIGKLTFGSAKKTGVRLNENGVINPLYNEDGSRNSNYVTQQMHYAYFGIQQKAKRYQIEEVNEGSQYLKLRHANMFNEGIAKDLKENQLSASALESSIKRAEELKVARTFSAFDKALNRLGLYLTPDYEVATLQETQVDAKEKLVEILLSQDNGADENLTASIAFLKDADAKIEYLPNAEKLENILFGYLNNNVIKKQVKGAMSPQIPSTFMEDLGTKRSGESNPAYKFYRLSKDGKRVLPMEIAMTLPLDLVDYVTKLGEGNRNKGLHIFNNNIKNLLYKIENGDKLSVEEKQLQDTITGIGYRIPTQDLDSLEYMIVKEFLPLETGQSIILPTEIVAKAGSDFDIDKLTVHFKHLDKGKARTKTVDSVEKAFIKMMGKFMPKKVIDKISLTQNFAEQAAIQDLKNQNITEELIQNLIGQSYSQLTDKQKESFAAIYEEFGEESIEVLSGTLLEEAKTWNLKAPVLSNFYQLDKAAIALVNNSKVEGSLADFVSAKEDYKQMDFFEQAKLYAKENNLDTFEEFEQGYKNGDARYMSDKDLFNAELETTKEILGNPINFGEFMTPIGDSILDDIIEQMKPYAADSSKKYSADVVSPRNQVNTSIDFWTGKGSMVGIVALQITALANRLKTKAYVDTNTALSSDTDSGLWFPFASNLKGSTIPINKTTNSENVLISEILSALATVVLDVAKDPKAAKLGFTLQTANAALYMLNLGVPVNVVFKFLSLPVIKNYLAEQKINESLLYNQEYGYIDQQTNQRKKEKKGISNFGLQEKYGVNEGLHSMINSFDSVKNSEAYEYFQNTQTTLNLIANEYNEKAGQFGYELEQFNKEGLTEEFLDKVLRDEVNFSEVLKARKESGIEETEDDIKKELNVKLLGTFLEVQRQSKIWGKMIKAYGHDTSRAKDSVTLDKFDEAKRIVDDSFIKDTDTIYLDDKGNPTQMGAYKDVYKSYANEVLSPNFYLTKQNSVVENAIDYYKDKITASLPSDKKDRAVMDFVNGYAMFSYLSSDESKENIKPFFEEGVVAKELLKLKGIMNNELLNRLSVLEEIRLTENQAEKEYYVIFNKTKLSDREKNKLVENWRMLRESPTTRQFAINLAKQTMLQTGNKSTYYSFTELIPFEIWEDIMYYELEAKDVASYFDLWRRQAMNASSIPNKTTLKAVKENKNNPKDYSHFATYGSQNAEAMSVKEVKTVKRSKEDSKRKKKVVQEKTLNYYVSLADSDGKSVYNLVTDNKGKTKIIVPFVKVQKLGNDKRVDYTKNPNDCNG